MLDRIFISAAVALRTDDEAEIKARNGKVGEELPLSPQCDDAVQSLAEGIAILVYDLCRTRLPTSVKTPRPSVVGKSPQGYFYVGEKIKSGS